MKKCVNCGRNETDNVICDPCRQSFPGDPALLEEVVSTFKAAQKILGDQFSVAGGIGQQESTLQTQMRGGKLGK
jgi:hypothetical protein